MKALRIAALGLILGGISAAVWAEKADKDKPINVEADFAQYDDIKQVMVMQGRVVLTKGTLLIRANRIEQREDPEGNQNMQATTTAPERVFFRQKREALDEYMEGEAERIDYDGKADVLTLTGRAVMRRLRGQTLADESIGHVIVFNNMTETMTINGVLAGAGAPSQRVRLMLSPKNDATKGNATPAPAPALRFTPDVRLRNEP